MEWYPKLESGSGGVGVFWVDNTSSGDQVGSPFRLPARNAGIEVLRYAGQDWRGRARKGVIYYGVVSLEKFVDPNKLFLPYVKT